MIICISLGVLVISQVVSSQRESARDRARTLEIHSAEGIVDQLLSELQRGNFQSEWIFDEPSGPDGIVTNAKIEYWDKHGNSLCESGDTSGAVRAQITATSSNEHKTLAGIEPNRTFEAEVVLEEERDPSASAAIFSAGELQLNNAAFVEGTTADVWTDKDNFTCQGSSGRDTITGNLYVPNGSTHMDNACTVNGNVYSAGHLSMPSTGTVRGDVYVKSSGISLGTQNSIIHGYATAPGGVTGQGSVLKGIRNDEPTSFPESRGFPPVEFVPGDWYSGAEWDDPTDVFQPWSGMGSSPERTAWKHIVDKNGVLNKGDEYALGRECVPMNNDWGNVGARFRLPEILEGAERSTSPRVFDARNCKLEFRSVTMELYGDTAIFAQAITFDRFNVTSGDGKNHRLWLIVPHEFAGSRPTMVSHDGL